MDGEAVKSAQLFADLIHSSGKKVVADEILMGSARWLDGSCWS
jgi:hypothetical protein